MKYEDDSLGNRMKTYENAFRYSLPIRMPVIVRVDGAHFHTYTQGLKRPVDENLVDLMNQTAIYLCSNIQGCKIAYVQSDEISLLLNNYETFQTQPWFENNIQKIVSTSAALASSYFSVNSWKIWYDINCEKYYAEEASKGISKEASYWVGNLPDVIDSIRIATFDSRVFILPKEEVNNYFLWRQQDATRNSIQSLARSMYSHNQLENKNSAQLQEMIFQKSGINWNDVKTDQKRGRCIVKQEQWIVDNEIPVFSQNKDYINQYLLAKEE